MSTMTAPQPRPIAFQSGGPTTPVEEDVTAPAFHAEVASAEFWAAVQRRRATASIEEDLEVAAAYRRTRAEQAAADLRR